MRLTVAFVLAVAAGPTAAQYKCTSPAGAVTYQQTPCVGLARAEPLTLLPAEPDAPERIRMAIAEQRVVVGMTRAEVDRSARRPPDAVNTSVRAGTVDHQLVYRRAAGPLYVYLTDGIVTSLTDSR
jgi:hypothetical protein